MACCSEREWFPPPRGEAPQLLLYNSLKDEKVPFVPAAGSQSKSISWYTCGPTVYDVGHMGHARNFVTFDVVRRVLEDYFGYDCMFVMNVTDVDDKIIMRARRNYLLRQYVDKASPAELRERALQAVQAEVKKQQEAVNAARKLVEEVELEVQAAQSGTKNALQRKLDDLAASADGEGKKLQNAETSLSSLQQLGAEAAVEEVLKAAGDYIAGALDKELKDTVTDHSIYRAHAAKYEKDFFEDLDALGCRRPDVLTRVTEYIAEIVAFVEGIVGNGMAYAANGSVYFDTRKFRESGHTYGKLKPWSVGSAMLAAESEANFETSEKRSPTDFALWKASKPGEPFWDSPWGKGRPGWHIECSAMASAVIGRTLDIHTGGEDLKFPHHDNELAQSEAYYHQEGCKQWVNYFLHCGHLSIEGHKMSKSLKNFITIKEALKIYTPRQIRLMFVLTPWWKPMVYGDQLREEMKGREALLRNFFQNVEAASREASTAPHTRWNEPEQALNKDIITAQQAVHAALLDSINTKAAMDALLDLIKKVNLYLAGHQRAATPPLALLLQKASSYVTRILSTFGLVDHPADHPGFTTDSSLSGADANGGPASAAALAGYLDAFAAFRDEIRAMAKQGAAAGEVLAACDRVRDQALVELGVRLEDRPDGRAVWKLDSPEALKAEVAAREAEKRAAQRKKAEQQLTKKLAEKKKLDDLMALPTAQEALSEKYSKFDAETGDPTHSKDGSPLEGKAKDKAKKDMDKARKVREPLAKLQADPTLLPALDADIARLQGLLASLKGAPAS